MLSDTTNATQKDCFNSAFKDKNSCLTKTGKSRLARTSKSKTQVAGTAEDYMKILKQNEDERLRKAEVAKQPEILMQQKRDLQEKLDALKQPRKPKALKEEVIEKKK